jgi:hypothetical protein
MMDDKTTAEIATLTDNWQDHKSKTKEAFIRLKNHLEGMGDLAFDFNARAGVSYSLRPRHKNQKKRLLFAMVDVIDDDPSDRWLSVCFYGEMITDPNEKGDIVPGGLMGEDGHCFDLDSWDDELISYIEERLTEAHKTAATEK